MKSFSCLLRAVFAVTVVMLMGSRGSIAAADMPTPPRIGMVSGEASFWRPGGQDWTPAEVNMPLAAGDALYTAEGGGRWRFRSVRGRICAWRKRQC